ncbi:MAG: 3-deoxy-D-manno-octulosonic acid transferase [Pseudomonadota bacterium]
MNPQPAPLVVRAYGLAAALLGPVAQARVAARLRAQGIAADRIAERRGHASLARPAGRLLWFHAASVGESLSVLRLITHLHGTDPDLSFLMTSGTATSAEILSRRLPPRCQHQFAPLDTRDAVTRFLEHWRPDAGVFVESELWPNMLQGALAAGVPLALVNARISERSAKTWRRLDKSAHYLMDHFRMIHCQDERTARHLRALGLARARRGVNLKSLAGPLPFDRDALAQLRAALGHRKVWLAASTHPGEDEIAVAAHRLVLQRQPETCLILVPRHPDRAAAIAKEVSSAGLRLARRSSGDALLPDTQVYLADTLGEMGLWYAIAPITCLFGSFSRVGGHNPYEPAHAGNAILHGPHYANFAADYAALDAAGAGQELTSADALGPAVATLLEHDDTRHSMQQAAGRFAGAQDDVMDAFARELCSALGLVAPETGAPPEHNATPESSCQN